MEIIEPNVEYWKQGNDEIAHVAKCARVCYASTKTTDNAKLVQNLLDKMHFSMLRHESCYYIVDILNDKYKAILRELNRYLKSPYIQFCIVDNIIYISTNREFIYDNVNLEYYLHDCKVSEDYFFIDCPNKDLFRFTFCVITQISTSRELNRVSPNNIAEQSTRYVNFGKKGGIKICKPYWYDSLTKFDKYLCRCYWHWSERIYNAFLHRGLKAQDSREFLPLCTATKCVYTYTLKEWKHIIDLRYYGTTGVPHPNAKFIAGKIKEELVKLKMIENE